VPGTVAISDDEMRRFAPSVFASQPIEGVSERYSFLPTSSILKGMRENGWVPVRAQEQSIRTEARRGFQKHVVRFARLQHLQTWEKNQVRPEVVLVNSHDKSSDGMNFYCAPQLTAPLRGEFAYVANVKSNTVSAYSVGSNGALTPVPGSPFATGHDPMSVTVVPTGRFAYVVNIDDSTI
jgi:Domain of unknown function (DUF932)